MSNDEEMVRLIWTVDGVPYAGTLSDYARTVESVYYGSGLDVSSTVLTWDNISDPVTWNVRQESGAVTEDYVFPVTVSVPGMKDSVTVFIDGAV